MLTIKARFIVHQHIEVEFILIISITTVRDFRILVHVIELNGVIGKQRHVLLNFVRIRARVKNQQNIVSFTKELQCFDRKRIKLGADLISLVVGFENSSVDVNGPIDFIPVFFTRMAQANFNGSADHN